MGLLNSLWPGREGDGHYARDFKNKRCSVSQVVNPRLSNLTQKAVHSTCFHVGAVRCVCSVAMKRAQYSISTSISVQQYRLYRDSMYSTIVLAVDVLYSTAYCCTTLCVGEQQYVIPFICHYIIRRRVQRGDGRWYVIASICVHQYNSS